MFVFFAARSRQLGWSSDCPLPDTGAAQALPGWAGIGLAGAFGATAATLPFAAAGAVIGGLGVAVVVKGKRGNSKRT